MRLTILNEEEIDRLYGIPRFTQEARAEYFALSAFEKTVLEQGPVSEYGQHSTVSRSKYWKHIAYWAAPNCNDLRRSCLHMLIILSACWRPKRASPSLNCWIGSKWEPSLVAAGPSQVSPLEAIKT